MAIDDPYMTPAQFRSRVGSIVSIPEDTLTGLLLNASRQIDDYCGQFFYRTAATARYLTARFADAIELPAPVAAVSEIATDSGERTYETVWSVTDFDLYPFDAADLGMPYTEIRRAPAGVFTWSTYPRAVRITAEWGWPSVPSVISEVCFLIANRDKSMWTAPFGVTGRPEIGQLERATSLTPIIESKLAPYRVAVV